MQEIESSSRLYKENDALFMTINAVKRDENNRFHIMNVTFVVKNNHLVTIRYEEITPFNNFLKFATNKPTFATDKALSLLLGILEGIIEKNADVLENISSTVEDLSHQIFTHEKEVKRDLHTILITMGVQGEINSLARDSLTSITRLLGYLKFNINPEEENLFKSWIETLAVDGTDLKDHSTFVGHKIAFILDASLGLINIEQNNIIKIFSIAAVVLLPPTLVASILWHELPFSSGVKLDVWVPFGSLSHGTFALLPYYYFKRKGWL